MHPGAPIKCNTTSESIANLSKSFVKKTSAVIVQFLKIFDNVNVKNEGYHVIIATLEGACYANPFVNVLCKYLMNH